MIHNQSRPGCAEVAVGAGCKGHAFGAVFKTANASSGGERKYGKNSSDRLCNTWRRQVQTDGSLMDVH
jgi:hypothetical protein